MTHIITPPKISERLHEHFEEMMNATRAALMVVMIAFGVGCSREDELPQAATEPVQPTPQGSILNPAEYPVVLVAIEPRYDTAAAFSEGLALVSAGTGSARRWSYIDREGKDVIQGGDNWYLAGPFREGVAAVGVLNGPDMSNYGNLNVPPEFLNVEAHVRWIIDSNRTAQRQTESPVSGRERMVMSDLLSSSVQRQGMAFHQSTWGYIDTRGNWVIKPQWAAARPFHEGWGVVSRHSEVPIEYRKEPYVWPVGYSDTFVSLEDPDGVVPTPASVAERLNPFGNTPKRAGPKLEMSHELESKLSPSWNGVVSLSDFSGGVASLSARGLDKWEPDWVSILDTRMAILTQSTSIVVDWPSEGKIAFAKKGVPEPTLPIDTSKDRPLPPRGGNEQKWLVEPGIFGFTDPNGVEVIKPAWRRTYSLQFHEGLCVVRTPQSAIVIDDKGNMVLDWPFNGIFGNFNEGLAVVEQSSGFGFVDKSGNFVVKPEWQGAEAFSCGLAAVKRNGKWGYIDKSGKLVTETKWDEAGPFKGEMAAVKLGDKWGYLKIAKR
ncbi:MAG: WG repeat-containing protein [Verrucomicrobiae bacterium]|nr:WG repeat-containing protein [Verrucomicrobiae bacterium]